MKVLWIGSLAWKKSGQYEFPVNGPGAVSGSSFEQNIIEGIEALGCDVDIISDYPYSTAISCKKGAQWTHNGNSNDFRLPYCGLRYISLLLKEYNVKKVIRERFTHSQYDVVIVYLIHYPYLASLPIVKRLAKKTKTVLICPDLPNMMDMSLNEKIVKRFLKSLDSYRINQAYKYVDAFVLFSQAMSDKLPIENKPHIVIEGVSAVDDLDITIDSKSHAILHAGTLHKNIGIEKIIQAFKYIEDKELQFWIFGDGDLVEYIKEASQLDPRIMYKGFVDRKELFEYLKRAKILINARNPKDEYTKYSFPSKMFEYIYSGTPFLTTKLEGIPSEYWEYVYTLKDDSPQVIASEINDVLNNSHHDKSKITLSRMFIKTTKGKVAQGLKLLNFLKLICAEK